MTHPLEGTDIHFVGIGGIGMSALARWLLAQHYDVGPIGTQVSRARR
jgi:UDP-N-acetylmuramate-alanine ligase